MDIWAIIKTFRGEEFAAASLRSIYKHVRGVIYVHSDVSWTGVIGNTVLDELKHVDDPDKKIVHLTTEGPVSQNEQYNKAIEYLQENQILFDYVMLIDTDEVWDEENWTRALQYLDNNLKSAKPVHALCTRLWSYIKSPYYRIHPDEPLMPVVFVYRDAVEKNSLDIRGALIQDRYKMMNVYFHHYCSVRKNFELVWEKHVSSCTVENEPMVDKEDWKKNVWNKLPNTYNLLPLKNHAANWFQVKVISEEQLPVEVRSMSLIDAFRNYPSPFRKVPLYNEILKEAGLPEDFGPGHPDWNIPSKRNKFEQIKTQTPARNGIVEIKVKDLSPSTTGKINVNFTLKDLPPSKKNKLLSSIKNEGKLCIMTIVSGDYQWYLPLFIQRFLQEFKDMDIAIKIFVRGECVLPTPFNQFCLPFPDDPCPDKLDGYTTACLRFLYQPENIEEYDYVLVTDCDMMMFAENPGIVDQHMLHLRINDLDCYDNYVSEYIDNSPRVPGVHFVTKVWWNKTKEVRAKYLRDLTENGPRDYTWDEVMLGKIILESGLRYPPESLSLWAHHGVHLGDYRLRIKNNQTTHPPLNEFHQSGIMKMLNNQIFMDLVTVCDFQAPELKIAETFKLLDRLARGK